MIVIAILYAAFTLYIAFYEYTRPRALHFDQLSFFHFYFGLNLCLPMIIVFGLLDGQRSQLSDYSLLAFHALRGVGVAEAGMLFVLTVLAYMSTRLGYAWMRGPVPPRAEIVEVAASDRQLNLAIWAGFSLMTIGAIYVLATSLGDDLVSGITQIVLFRAKEQFEPDFATANAFSFINAMIPLAAFALLCARGRARVVIVPCALILLVLTAYAASSRRALVIGVLVWYFATCIVRRDYLMKMVVPTFLLFVLIIAFGEAMFRAAANQSADTLVTDVQEARVSQKAYDVSLEVGISAVESIGSLQLYEGPPRFGSDHMFSALRLIPERSLGVDIEWPERMVRRSTAYLTGDPTELDVPPGYIGQLWIDGWLIGVLVGAALLGFVGGVIERVIMRPKMTRESIYFYVIAGYLWCLPLNSGTLDFVFSVDVLPMLLFLWLIRSVPARGAPLQGRHA